MDARTIKTPTHGRYLVSGPPHPAPRTSHPALLVGFHGYMENAGVQMSVLQQMAGERPWCLVSVQALNRFYTRANEIAGNWMTREDRDLAIADNIAYVAAVVSEVARDYGATGPLVYAGFSQGVAMAYRAAAFAGRACAGLIVLGGDLPPDVAPVAGALPPVLLGRGTTDTWYTPEKSAADLAVLRQAGAPVTEFVFEGGHVWDPSFITRAGAFLVERMRP